MRELKFRCWDTRNNRWCDIDSWLPPFPAHFNLNEIFSFAEKDSICIQQYIGREDKNGVKIYEGDILNEKFTVEFLDGRFRFMCMGADCAVDPKSMQITGNIFENEPQPENIDIEANLKWLNQFREDLARNKDERN
jgi:hypothetical protein